MTKKTSPAMPLTLTILTAQVARNINDNILIIIVKAPYKIQHKIMPSAVIDQKQSKM